MKVVATVLWGILLLAIQTWPEMVAVADRGDFFTRQTARVAVLYWGVAIAGMLWPIAFSSMRWLWTLASVAYVVHVATAFQWAHHWSHAKAYQHVQEASGFGEGIFVSYAFTLFWVFDVLCSWASSRMYQKRHNALTCTIHGLMAFVVFNGTVVYETGFIRWVGLTLFGLLGGLCVRRVQQYQHPPKSSSLG